MEIVDSLSEFEPQPSIYGSFKNRALASIIDSLILLPLVAIDWFNETDWKSQFLLTLVLFVGLIYKPIQEYNYGATIGKKFMKLMVVNKDYEKINLKEVLLRNIFDIVWRIFFFVITLIIYKSEGFLNISSNKEFVDFQKDIINLNPYLLLYLFIIIIEIVFILTDKKRRALHDRIGNTFVIKS